MNRTIKLALLAALALALALVALRILNPEQYQDWWNLTFHEPAHYIFEFQNEAVVALFLVPLWQHAKRKAVREAIKNHDAEYHPHSHRVDSDAKA